MLKYYLFILLRIFYVRKFIASNKHRRNPSPLTKNKRGLDYYKFPVCTPHNKTNKRLFPTSQGQLERLPKLQISI